MRPMLTQSIAAAGALFAAMVLPATAGIQVPDTVDRGDRVEVVVTDPSATARIELWGPVTQTGTGTQLLSRPLDGTGAVLPLDQPAGSYELRQIGADGTVLAREAIDVSASPVALTVPGTVEPGGEIIVIWHGPGQTGDRLQVVDPVSGKVVDQADATGGQSQPVATSLTAPDQSGTFWIRYLGGAGTVLGTREIAVDGGKDWVRSPLVVGPGETFDVEWNGSAPVNKGVRIATPDGVPVDGDAALMKVVDGQPRATLIAPRETGDYVIEIIDLASGAVGKTLPLDVDPS